MYVCICVCMYVCMYVYMYVYITALPTVTVILSHNHSVDPSSMLMTKHPLCPVH